MPVLKTYPENKILKAHKAPHILVLVADAREAAFYSCKPQAGKPKLTRFDNIHAEKIEFQSEPGRSYESAATARHALSPHSDPKQDNRHNFARVIVKKLREAFDANGFVNLVLIAPPKVLGDLRAELDENLKRVLIVEAAKELCHANETELGDYLSSNGLI